VNRTRIERRWSETTRIALIGGGCLASGAWLATTPWAFFAIMPLALGVGSGSGVLEVSVLGLVDSLALPPLRA